jgi:hypothetical protein
MGPSNCPSGAKCLRITARDAGTDERHKEKSDDFFIRRAAIAEELWHVAHQERSAWSFNVELRPYAETW